MSSLKHNLLLFLTSFAQKFHHLVCSLRPFPITANITPMMIKIVFIASQKKDIKIYIIHIYFWQLFTT